MIDSNLCWMEKFRVLDHCRGTRCRLYGDAPMALQLAAISFPAGEGSLTHYLKDIRQFPMLGPQEEFMLAKRWREQGDRDAADQLITSHLRLAVKIAMGYRGYGLPITEIVSEGNVGLMQAINRFEPDRGFRFATYAIWWIRAAIQDYILRSWSLGELGHTLGVDDQDVVDMNRRLGGDLSLNASIRDEESSGEWLEQLVDESPSPEAIVVELDEMDRRDDALVRAIGGLSDRE